MNQKKYITGVVILTLVVAAVLAYTINSYMSKYPLGRDSSQVQASVEKTERKELRKEPQIKTTGTTPVATEPPKNRTADLEKYSAEFEQAKVLEEQNKHLEAKKILESILPVVSDPGTLQQDIYRLNIRILFSPLITNPPDGPKSEIYTVKSGDTLDRIARTNKTTVDLLKESNGIKDPRNLQVGDRLKVVTDTFQIVVSRAKNTMTLIAGDTVLKEYPVGTGEYSKTPVGDFTIENRIIDPPWRGIPYGDERNVLGTRWMGLKHEGETPISGYGIHGTWEPETIGKSISQGCIRMYNEDVEELYKIVSVGTRVKIID